MDFFEEFVPFLFFLIVATLIGVSKKKARKKNRSGQSSGYPKGFTPSVGSIYERPAVGSYSGALPRTYVQKSNGYPSNVVMPYRPERVSQKPGKKITSDISGVLFEDRDNDWLAKQRREEQRSLRQTSAMFDLRMEHQIGCDARLLRDEHARKHSGTAKPRSRI